MTHKNKSRLSQIAGQAGNERGRRHEQRVLNSFDGIGTDPWPDWVKSGRAATPEEDANGIDIVVESDVGPIFLQVKSSKTGVIKFARKRRRSIIGTVIIRNTNKPEGVRNKVIYALIKTRAKIQQRRGEN